MQVRRKQTTKVVPYGDLQPGNVFEYGGVLFMKMLLDGRYNSSVSLHGGVCDCFTVTTEVIPVNGVFEETK